MNEIIFEFPARIAVEFAGRDTPNPDVRRFLVLSFVSPFDANFGGESSDVSKVFKISPKFNLGTRFLL